MITEGVNFNLFLVNRVQVLQVPVNSRFPSVVIWSTQNLIMTELNLNLISIGVLSSQNRRKTVGGGAAERKVESGF
jgi:hypothetical protein